MVAILGKDIGPIGYGMGNLTSPPRVAPEDQAIECLRTAAELGCLAWNAGEFYGPPTHNSLVLLNRFFAKYPEYANRVLLNVKGAMENYTPNGSPEFVRKSVDNCLAQLGGKGKIDMYECGRRDTRVPMETTLNTLKELVEEGKIGSVALTEVNATTIREAAKIVNISAVEIELSLWNTDPLRNGVLSTCAELGIPVFAYCPLGRGFLTGKLNFEDIPEGDYRRMLPKNQPENLKKNLQLVKQVETLAEKKGFTTAQVALGWILGLSKQEGMPLIVPIPGTSSPDRVRENAAAAALADDEMKAVEAILSLNPVVGDRYHAHGMKLTDL
ncbi:Aldo/keto reductase [Mytilinidion resinicola]|uniref:Aldo/keto reductase n=1 Tax=Mytilinidion resinicola TaxID=574789 RepID=A0A6A6Z836_9PEZI|nr:Aldo/keto reductase [Mytilinidion resinicola]KAF2816387.1 Aldo/keto reductase [Mytilinidion resinicola]